MTILFAEFLSQKLNRLNPIGGTRWSAFETLVAQYDQSPPDWVTGKGNNRKLRQLDKFEPALTYYLFAALAEATNNLTNVESLANLFSHAFAEDIALSAAQQVAKYHVGSLRYEAFVAPNQTLREEVKRRIDNCPVPYIRTLATGRKKVRFESATRLDCFVGDPSALGKRAKRLPGEFALGIEAKFTSDIDDKTTYSPHRNQIARIVEVGNQRANHFVFLLVAPRTYRLASSRFFVYKMREYQGGNGITALRRDLLLPQTDETLARWIQNMGWLDWEHIVEFLYPGGFPRTDWKSDHHKELQEFLIQRRLWPR